MSLIEITATVRGVIVIQIDERGLDTVFAVNTMIATA